MAFSRLAWERHFFILFILSVFVYSFMILAKSLFQNFFKSVTSPWPSLDTVNLYLNPFKKDIYSDQPMPDRLSIKAEIQDHLVNTRMEFFNQF